MMTLINKSNTQQSEADYTTEQGVPIINWIIKCQWSYPQLQLTSHIYMDWACERSNKIL